MMMTTDIQRYEQNTVRIVRATGLLSVIAAMFLAGTLLDTIILPPPVVEQSSNANVMYAGGFSVLEVSRKFSRYNENEVEIHSVLRRDSQVIPLTHGPMKFDQEVINVFTLPPGLNGRYCIDAEIHYSYRLSLRQHTKQLNDLCLNIKS